MSNIAVLIVGAGPTGLMMAYELARHGISFRIIDKKPEATQTSNAAALQTRSLEIFKQLGLANDFLRAGQPCHSICFHDKGKEFARAKFDKLDSVYPYILSLPQASTERILEQRLTKLEHHVERSRDLTGIKVNLTEIVASIAHEDGVQELIHCQYLLGTDGAHSAVRDAGGFHFPGDDISEQFVVADAALDSYLPNDQIHIFSNNGYMLGVFPLGGNHYRLGGNMQLGYSRKIYTENEVRDIVAARSSGKFNAREVSWISPFWIHSKMADNMRRANIFLLGDAAHIHSPIGGQGMNTGLQDAHNLAWKLALVLQGRANPTLLDSYEQERKPVIQDVVETTERFTRILLLKNPILLFIRKQIIRLAFAIPVINKYITRRMTQLDIRYKTSVALDQRAYTSSRSPTVGERAPDVKLNHSNYFYDYLNDANHHIICFTGDSDIFKAADICKKINYALLGPFKDIMKLHMVTPHRMDDPVDQIIDETNSMHLTYQIKKMTILVIRPDGYIGYKTSKFDIDKLKTFLSTYLLSD